MSDEENNGNVDVETAKLVPVYKVGGIDYPNRLREDLLVRRGDLSEDFAEHAQRFAWYSTAYEIASDEELRLKEQLARVHAQIDAKVRAEARTVNQKLTEKMVENTVITHPEYRRVQEDYLAAKLNTGLLKAGRDAMIHRRDMLISLGANYRAEGRSDISLREEQYRNGYSK